MIARERAREADDLRAFPERIAALIPSGDAIGPGRQLTALAQALQGAGIDCLVVAFHRRGQPPSALLRYLQETGVRHCVVEDRGPVDWRMVSRVGTVLRRWRPSIVQTHCYKATAVAYLLRQRRPPWPWIGFFHGATTANLKSRFYHWVDRQLLGAAERLVVMSQAQARAFGHCGRRVRTIYNAALPLAPAGDPSERDGLAAIAHSLRPPVLGVVSRLSPEKGIDIFLDACALLLARGLAFSVLIAGDGPARAHLEARCARLGLQPRVRFLGQVSAVDVVYQHLDLLVLPSRSEGLPNTLLEALQADIPLVTTAVGAVPDVIGQSPAARLVAPGSAAALAEAIERALTQGDSPEAAAARREVVSGLSLERRAAAHVQLYRELLEEWCRDAAWRTGARSACAGSPAR